jgi:hypothetical protein
MFELRKANDGGRSPADASENKPPPRAELQRPLTCKAKLFSTSGQRVGPYLARPYDGLSRMKGNFHVRFLEGGGPATARLHSAARSPSPPAASHAPQQPPQQKQRVSPYILKRLSFVAERPPHERRPRSRPRPRLCVLAGERAGVRASVPSNESFPEPIRT